jgi:hypothetical protein
VTSALKRGVWRPSACVRGGQIDSATASARTPRGARALLPRSGLEARAVLTHTVLTPKLRVSAVVRRHTAVASGRRVASRRSVLTARSERCAPVSLHDSPKIAYKLQNP